VSARERSIGLPLSRVSSTASSSTRASISSATRVMITPRSAGANPLQRRSAWAAAAASTAASTSASVAWIARANASPVAGSTTSKREF
jgi:hypothetical protein